MIVNIFHVFCAVALSNSFSLSLHIEFNFKRNNSVVYVYVRMIFFTVGSPNRLLLFNALLVCKTYLLFSFSLFLSIIMKKV